jgi:hypothetical protein
LLRQEAQNPGMFDAGAHTLGMCKETYPKGSIGILYRWR